MAKHSHPFEVVCVEWLDARMRSGPSTLASVREGGLGAPCVSCGFLVDDREAGIIIVTDIYDEASGIDPLAYYHDVPWGMIRRVTLVRTGRAYRSKHGPK